MAIRCSALRPCSPKTSRSPRTSRTCLSAATRPRAEPRRRAAPARCGRAGAAAAAEFEGVLGVVERATSSSVPTSSSAIPVQPESTASSAWYSSASRPTADALTRIGRSLRDDRDVAGRRRRGSCHREDAAVVVRRSRNPAGSSDGSAWFSSTRSVPPVADRQRRVQPPVLHAQVVEQPQRLPGEVAELGVVPLGLQLGDHHDRQHDLVLGEAQQRLRVGQQHGGVEDEGAARPTPRGAHAPGLR